MIYANVICIHRYLHTYGYMGKHLSILILLLYSKFEIVCVYTCLSLGFFISPHSFEPIEVTAVSQSLM